MVRHLAIVSSIFRVSDSAVRPFVGITLALSLLPLVVGGFWLVGSRGLGYWPHAATAITYSVLSWAAFSLAARFGRAVRLFLLLAAMNLVLFSPELWLRVAGFRFEAGIQFGYPKPSQFRRFEEHRDLFWRLPAGSSGVNRQGFRTAEITARKPGVTRVAVIGDSVAAQGFPEMAEVLLREDPSGRSFEVINFSMVGYSSHQGRAVLALYGELIDPDLLLVAFGWNDHWVAWGDTDADKVMVLERPVAQRWARWVLSSSRTTQLLRSLIVPLVGQERPLLENRVSLQQYRHNLLSIGDWAARRGAVPLFLTLPSAHPRLGVPDYLADLGFAPDAESVIRFHRQYNEIVREVAAGQNWPVLDLERDLALTSQPEKIFTSDGIHLREAGLVLVAKRMSDAVLAASEARGGYHGPH